MQINIDYDSLEECINEMKLVKANIRDIVEKMFFEINSLNSKGYWNGDAADFYIKKANSFRPTLEQSEEQLGNYIVFLTNMLMTYQNIDSSASNN